MVAESTSLDRVCSREGLLAVYEIVLENCMRLECGDPERYLEECDFLGRLECIIKAGDDVTYRRLLDESAGSAEDLYPSPT